MIIIVIYVIMLFRIPISFNKMHADRGREHKRSSMGSRKAKKCSAFCMLC